jgi:hypothetical protein
MASATVIATAQVNDQWQLMLVRQSGEISLGNSGGEALNSVIAGMHLHQQRRVAINGGAIIF